MFFRRTALSLLLFLSATSLTPAHSREFSVLVFNVENLFDIDGEALFSDYQMEKDEGEVPYSADLLLKKLHFTADTVASIDRGEGPDIILFQEFERDRTPNRNLGSTEAFLAKYSDLTVDEMLTEPVSREISDLPSFAFLLKALADRGLVYPYLATPPLEITEDTKPHINGVFSRFPITDVLSFPTPDAREILAVRLDVYGHPLTVINNHWKSGASRPETEPSRIENARTTRRALENILAADPNADVVIGGDLNSYYNQSLAFPEMERTGINDVLGSQGDEAAVAAGRKDLYNLWFELPIIERYTETWRDMKGTLMHIIVTPGLYDDRGIQYIDNSFERVVIPGLNVDEWGRPRRFSFDGGGRGGSDHLPLLARFKTVDEENPEPVIPQNPGRNESQPSRVMLVDYDLRNGGPEALDPDILKGLDENELNAYRDEFFLVRGEWISWNPPAVRAAGHDWEVYSSRDTVWARMDRFELGDPVEFYAELGKWDEKFQWVIRDPSWLEVVGRRGLEPRTN